MRLLSWLQRPWPSFRARRAAQALRRRYGPRAYDLASTFITTAADEGDEKAQRHWSAVLDELRRINVTKNSGRKKDIGAKRRIIEWD